MTGDCRQSGIIRRPRNTLGDFERNFLHGDVEWTKGRPGDGWGAAGGGRLGSGQEATEAIARRFFDFFIDVPRRLLCLEALSGGVGGGAGDHYR